MRQEAPRFQLRTAVNMVMPYPRRREWKERIQKRESELFREKVKKDLKFALQSLNLVYTNNGLRD